MRATLLNDDEEALQDLRAKEEKKRAKEERQKKAEEKRKRGAEQGKAKKKKRPVVEEDSEEEENVDDPAPTAVRLNDSSEYSDEFQQEETYLTTEQYPFAEKEPEVRDFFVFSKLVFSSYFLCCRYV